MDRLSKGRVRRAAGDGGQLPRQGLVSCQALFFGVGKNDSRLVGRLLSVSQPEFYELTQHEEGTGKE